MVEKTLVRYRWWLLALGVLTGCLAWPVSDRLTIDRRIPSLFAPNDPALQGYRVLRDAFGGNVVTMLVYRDDELLTDRGMSRNAALTDTVRGIPGVRGVLSPAVLNATVSRLRPAANLFAAETPRPPPLADRDDPLATGLFDLFAGYTHSADGHHAAVVAILEPDHPPATLQQLRACTSRQPSPVGDSVLVGEPVLVAEGFDLIARDGAKLSTWTVGLLSIVILVTLRSIRFTLLAALSIGWAVVVTRALMVAVGIELSIVSTILTAIVTVIVVASVLHLGSRQHSISTPKSSRRMLAATRRTLGFLWAPILWTCLTDAVGFAALAASDIRPVREFGGMMAVSAIACLLALVCFAPAVMSWDLHGRRNGLGTTPHRKRSSLGGLQRVIEITANRSADHRLPVLFGTLILGAICTVTVSRIETETSFLKNFRSDSEVARAYRQVEVHLGGAGVWDIVLPAPHVLTQAYLDSIGDLQAELRRIEIDGHSLAKVISMADAERVASTVPLLSVGGPEIRMTAMRAALPVFSDALLTPAGKSPRHFRIMLRSRERLPAETKWELIRSVRQSVARHAGDPNFQATLGPKATEPALVTGYYVMLATLVKGLISDQWRCFALALIGVFALLLVMTRSLWHAGIAVLGNALPAMVVLTVMGLVGGKLNLGAAMIAAVSLGLSIDGSVHLLFQYRRSVVAGRVPRDAAVYAATQIGLPVTLATLALAIGFGVLTTSEFVPTATFGALVAATLTLGTLVNLTVMPAALAARKHH